MLKIEQEKRRALVLSFTELLQEMQLNETAAVLASEAALNTQRDIEQDVRDIVTDDNIQAEQKSAAVAAFCKQCIQNYLREGKVEEALQIYEIIVPLHCPAHIDQFSLLFAEDYEHNPKNTASFLQSLLERPKAQQQSTVSVLGLKRQVWFMKSLGQGVLLVDRESSAFVVVEGEVLHKREKLHSEKVFTVASNGQQFATGSVDRTAKVWDSAITLLHTIDLHRARINAIAFCANTIACFDQDSVVSVHSLPEETSPIVQRIAVFRTASPFSDTCYFKSARKIIGVMHRGMRSSINSVSIRKKRVDKLIDSDRRIYAIELSLNEKLVFANVAPCEIRAYCLSSRTVVLLVKGFVQEKNLMRMSQGGKDGAFLAVSSEEGCVRVYEMAQGGSEEVLKVVAQSQQSVNCVLWKKEELFFACDAGNLEHFVPVLPASKAKHKLAMNEAI